MADSTNQMLTQIDYSEFPGEPNEWSISLGLDPLNLIVGRNASGKTRTINLIGNIAKSISGRSKHAEGRHSIALTRSDFDLKYFYSISSGVITSELLTINGTKRLFRSHDGRGSIYNCSINQLLDFHIPNDQLAATTKRDLEQHPFLEDLFHWATGVRHYRFAEDFGSHYLVQFVSEDASLADPNDQKSTAGAFRRGILTHGNYFAEQLVRLMREVSFPVTNVLLTQPKNLTLALPDHQRNSIVALCVREEGIEYDIWSAQISTGMFRCLAILIHVLSASLDPSTTCILIDDIGEGLDFERSRRLANALLSIAAERKIQLVMTTNDRFVMNTVSISIWKGLKRRGREIEVLTPKSSPALFNDFAFSGLSNFDFFASQIFGDEDELL